MTEHEYRIAPGTDLWISGGQSRPFMQSNVETIRGFATSMSDRGADAIYLFNHFARTDSKIWYLDASGQKKESRHTMLSLLNAAGSTHELPIESRRHILTNHDPVPPSSSYKRPLPATLNAKRVSEFSIHLGPWPDKGRVMIRVGLNDRPGFRSAQLKAQMNGVNCGSHMEMPRHEHAETNDQTWQPTLTVAAIAPRMVEFDVPLRAIRRSYNIVTLGLSTAEEQEVVWLECLITP